MVHLRLLLLLAFRPQGTLARLHMLEKGAALLWAVAGITGHTDTR
eukprot:CAMPEP_0178434274 /NCGR_PEP_ID=MMETSP0689_2-20121128/33339_1 /TAXON_ID=160604 /ORGANISM="Amphidinium massartii, Strain CS-259" /LENGTH=44 /DNA_ID= /DNA_START= /DNA_END= /DNA_ORIENTATION=